MGRSVKYDCCPRRKEKAHAHEPVHARPTWPNLAHQRLDEAVFAAHGWKSDLTDEEILEKVLSLNLERAKRYCHYEDRTTVSNAAISHYG